MSMENTHSTEQQNKQRLEDKFETIVTPFQSFMRDQATASILLILCTVIALLIANHPLKEGYHELLSLELGIHLDDWTLSKSIHHWINDGLMSIFFFILGLEIKRELLAGDLQSKNRLVPVLAAAAGGMLLPAILFTLITTGTAISHGWGIPMATDTAFAVGILALLRNHIPKSLIAFLGALAIIDDIGAILVIAFVYTNHVDIQSLFIAAGLLGFLVTCNMVGIRRPSVYLLVGSLVWYTTLQSGVHATIAGILVAFTVPARAKKGKRWFLHRIEDLLKQIELTDKPTKPRTPILAEDQQHAVLQQVEESAKLTTTPLQRWESGLETPVSLFVLPIFALANAGVTLQGLSVQQLFQEPLSLGIMLALVLGKSLGIGLFGWLSIRLNAGRLPPAMNVSHLFGLGLLGGVGFTMSLFIADLSFSAMPETAILAKSGILLGSLLAGVLGFVWLRFSPKSSDPERTNLP